MFDDPVFFKEYRKLRKNADCANNLIEKPAILSMIGDVKGKTILDLGCGIGENCRLLAEKGAASVLGIDASEKMLSIARRENKFPNVEYRLLDMESIDLIPSRFDLVVSSLAIHYVEDFNALICNIYNALHGHGLFVFSQEHPLTTAPMAGAKWIYDDLGEVDHYRLTDYMRHGKRTVCWFVNDVIKYHRTFSDLVNGLVTGGFQIEEMRESMPSDAIIQRIPSYAKDLHKPDFLLIKARKLSD